MKIPELPELREVRRRGNGAANNGDRPTTACYPDCAVSPHSAACAAETTVTITLIWHSFEDLSPALLYEVLQFRQNIFVVEQRSPYPDLDGLDPCAAHLLLREDDGLAGYLRLIPPEGEAPVRIGRMAVAAACRGRGLARRLVVEGLRRHTADFPHRAMILGAQTYLAPFYASLGFVAVSPPYDDYGVPHIDMERPAGAG